MAQLSQAVDHVHWIWPGLAYPAGYLRGAGAVVMSHGSHLLLNISGGGEEE